MSTNSQPYSFSREHSVILPSGNISITVEKRDWERLKKCIARSKSDIDWWSNFCSAFVGIAGSAIITWLSIDSKTGNIPVILLCVSIGSLIAAVICFIGARSNRDHVASKVNDINDVIKDIESNLQMEQNQK